MNTGNPHNSSPMCAMSPGLILTCLSSRVFYPGDMLLGTVARPGGRYDKHKSVWRPEPVDQPPVGERWVGRRTLARSESGAQLRQRLDDSNPWLTTQSLSFGGMYSQVSPRLFVPRGSPSSL